MAKMTLEQGQARWAVRAAKIAATHPKTFKGVMRQKVYATSKNQLDRMVYAEPSQGKRSGNLRRGEKLEFEGEQTACLVNDARAVATTGRLTKGKQTGAVYAWYVAEGHKAFTLPKRDKPYVWYGKGLSGKRLKRGGLKLKYGKQWNFSRGPLHIPAMKARPWRKKAIEAARTELPKALQKATAEAMKE